MEPRQGEIYKRMADVSKKIGAIEKNSHHQQNFKFRRIDDIYNGVHDALTEAEVFCIPRVIRTVKEREIQTSKGGTGFHMILEIEFDFYGPDGSCVTARTWGESIDYGDKSINKCMSIAHKYALIQVFTIPTQDISDPDDESHDNEDDKKSKENADPEKAKYLNYFAQFSVNEKMLVTYLKKPLFGLNEADKIELKSLAEKLKNGGSFFDILREKSTKNSLTELLL